MLTLSGCESFAQTRSPSINSRMEVKMMSIVRTCESEVIKTMGKWWIICQAEVTTNNLRKPMRIQLLFCTGSKRHVDISRLVRPTNRATITTMRPALDPATDILQLIDSMTTIIYSVLLTINTHRLETLTIQTRYIQASFLTNTDQRLSRQEWQDE